MVELTDNELSELVFVYVFELHQAFLHPDVAERRGLWDLCAVGLLEVKAIRRADDGSSMGVLFKITEEGVELLQTIPDKRVAFVCSDVEDIVLQCVPKLELEDLPEFLTSMFSGVRKAAQERSYELLKQRKRRRFWKRLLNPFQRGVVL